MASSKDMMAQLKADVARAAAPMQATVDREKKRNAAMVAAAQEANKTPVDDPAYGKALSTTSQEYAESEARRQARISAAVAKVEAMPDSAFSDGSSVQPTVSSTSSTGMVSGSASGAPATVVDPNTIVVTAEQKVDDRIRLSAITASAASQVYGPNDPANNILAPLYATGGLLFPYTPTITVSQAVNWDPIALVHTNYDINAYNRTPSVSISVSGEFTAQNQQQGEYCAAAIHFLRTVSKSYFGEKDSKSNKAGLPPPVLRFRGYGDAMFKDIRCVVKSHSYTFDPNVDHIRFTLQTGQTVKIPSLFTISVELGVQQTPQAQREDFSLDEFRTGELLRNSSGWF